MELAHTLSQPRTMSLPSRVQLENVHVDLLTFEHEVICENIHGDWQ